MKHWKHHERWLGGYVRVVDGVPTFYIERRNGSDRYHVCTRVHTEAAAQKQLARFEANPHDYRPNGSDGERVQMTGARIASFTAWQLSGADAVTPKHALYVARYLTKWMEQIGKRDLRSLKLHELKKWLAQHEGAHGLRIAALKVFFKWMREEEGLLKHSEDVTLNLPVPQARPEQRLRQKALDWKTVEAILPHLDDAERDCIAVLVGTAWHLTELERFAKGGEISGPDGDALAVLVVQHKNRETALTRLRVQSQVDAAQRIRARGHIPYRFSSRFGDASEAAGLPRVTAGVFRHSVSTWAVQAGATPEQVSRFLNHKDARTARKFYIDMRLAPPAVPVMEVRTQNALPAGSSEPTPEPPPSSS